MSEKDRIVSLSAIGLDSPGLVSKITSKIFEMGGNILDVEENCRKGLFSIFLIVDFAVSTCAFAEVSAAMDSIGAETGLKVVLGVHGEGEITYPGSKEHHVVTVLGEDKPGIIAKVAGFFHQLNINIESCKMIARGKFFCMEMGIDTGGMVAAGELSPLKALEQMKRNLMKLCKELNQSIVIQSEDIYNKKKKLVVFDVESTLIQEASLKSFLQRIKGRASFSDPGTDSGKVGENELQILIRNARMLKGIGMADFRRFGEVLQLNPGALELIGVLKSMGFKIALLSSGFSFFIKEIFEAAGVDYAFANSLKVDEGGVLTGELEAPVITSATKNEILEFIMKMENVTPDQVIAVGDGSTQTHFIKNVGLSIAFKPNHKSTETDGVLTGDQIIHILYCLGIPKTEIDKYLKP